MPGLGISELLVLAVLILILVRTEDLPKIMRVIGRVWANFYRYYLMLKREMRQMERSIGIEEEMKDIRSVSTRLNSEIASFNREIREDDTSKETSQNEVEDPIQSSTRKEAR